MHLVTPAPGTFTTQELERLAVYRAAVEAGFYTDEELPGAPAAEGPPPGAPAISSPSEAPSSESDIGGTVEPPRDPGATSDQPGR